jgi:hypothetical protein
MSKGRTNEEVACTKSHSGIPRAGFKGALLAELDSLQRNERGVSATVLEVKP